MGKRIERVGQKFGTLTVIDFGFSKKRQGDGKGSRVYWECVCECGTINFVEASKLSKIKSCGCLKNSKGNQSHFWKGEGEISGHYFSNLKWCAKKRKIPFEITIKDIWNLFVKQNRKCAISGVKLNPPTYRPFGTASLDRIDPRKGYNINNVQWVHKDINVMKWNFSQTDFLSWCRIIVKHLGEIDER